MALLTTLKTIIASALFWSLSLLVVGAIVAGIGVGIQFGLGFGLIVGGLFAVFYGAAILRGIKNG